jgi:hypothetical protein
MIMHWLRAWASPHSRTTRQRPRAARSRSFRPRLEPLEQRLAPATFTVVLATDAGGAGGQNVTATTGDLRYCINQANISGAGDLINFAIPGGGIHVITLSAANGPLPAFSDRGATIDGRTQGGAGYTGSPLVEVDGSLLGAGAIGLDLTARSITVDGLAIDNFKGSGITVDGIAAGTGLRSSNIFGNFIGIDPATLKAAPDGTGIILNGGDFTNTIGGLATGSGNVISGNTGDGILIHGSSTTTVEGNFIGTDPTGTVAVPNGGNGVSIAADPIAGFSATGNIIGTNAVGARNIISGNTGIGVLLDDSAGAGAGFTVTGNRIQNNVIGGNATGLAAVPNALGVLIDGGAAGNFIGGLNAGTPEGNVIAFNTGAGVAITGNTSTGNLISLNSITANGGLGIDLGNDGVTPNSVGGPHVGPNHFQNFPILNPYTTQGTITGSLNSEPNTTFTIELFANAAPDPSGDGQARDLLRSPAGTLTVTTDAYGNATFTFNYTPLPGEPFLTATATDPNNNTSEFSPWVDAGLALRSAALTIPEGSLFNGTVATFTDGDPAATTASFTAMINWGDGTAPTAGTIVAGVGSLFSVTGSHQYLEQAPAPGYTFPVTVTVTDTAANIINKSIAGGSTTGGSTLLTLPSTAGLSVGMLVTGPVAAGIPVGTVIASLSSATTVTLSNAAANPASGTFNFASGVFVTNSLASAPDASLTATSVPIAPANPQVGTTFSHALANFTDADPNGTLTDYSVTVNWGDGSSSIANNNNPTVTVTGNTTTTSASVLNLSSTTGIVTGMTVTGPNIPAGTTVTSVATNTVTLSSPATTQGSGTFVFTLSTTGSTGTTNVLALSSIAGISSGMTVAGPNIPTGTTVLSVSSSTSSVTLSNSATAAGTGTFTFTQSVSGSTNYAANVLSGLTSTAGIVAGMTVIGPNIPAGTFVTSVLDGTTLTLSSPATLSATGQSFKFFAVLLTTNSSGGFTVTAGHNYTVAGTYTLAVTITDSEAGSGGASVTVSQTAAIPDAPLTATILPITPANPQVGSTFSQALAAFTDADPNATTPGTIPAVYSVTVNWGDGTLSGTSANLASVSGSTVSSANVLTLLSTANIQVGMTVTGPNIPSGTFVTGVTSSTNTVTLSNPATATGSGTFGFTLSQSGSTSSSTPTTLSLSSTAGIVFGMTVVGPNIQAGTTVMAVSSTTVTLSQGATAAAAGTFSFTLSATGNTSSSANILTLTSTAGIVAGMSVIGPNLPAGTFVVSVSSATNTVTLSNAATFSSPGSFAFYSVLLTSNGSGGFTVTSGHGYAVVGNFTITVMITDYAGASATVSENVGVSAQTPTHLAFLQQPTTTVAGGIIQSLTSTLARTPVTVEVLDSFGNLAVGDNTDVVKLALSTNPTRAALGGTLSVTVSGGIATFANLTISTVGTGYVLSATSGSLPAALSAPFNISPTTHFSINAPASNAAGSTFAIVVVARTATNLPDSTYQGTVSFTSSDKQAVVPIGLPANYTFTAADSGAHVFFVTLATAGSQSVTATDISLATVTGKLTTTVVAGPTSTFVMNYPASTLATAVHPFTVTAKDAFGNTSTGYTGTVRLSSTDPVFPTTLTHTFTTLNKGVFSFSAAFGTAGNQSLTATDTVTATITGSEPGGINVYTLAPAIAGPTKIVTGQPAVYTLTAAAGPLAPNAKFTYRLTFNGVAQVIVGPNNMQITHVFTTIPTNPGIPITVVDSSGKTATGAALSVTVGLTEIETDLSGVGSALFIGTPVSGTNTITISPADGTGKNITVTIDGMPRTGNGSTVINHIYVFDQGGTDTIKETNTPAPITVPAVVYGGVGNDVINFSQSGANNILLGGGGTNTLMGGTGRDLLLGGNGVDALVAGSGGDILIGGTTSFDTNTAALLAIAAEWFSTDAYLTRVNDILGQSGTGNLNGAFFLNATTVHPDLVSNQLLGGTSQDWFFLGALDGVSGLRPGEIVTAL